MSSNASSEKYQDTKSQAEKAFHDSKVEEVYAIMTQDTQDETPLPKKTMKKNGEIFSYQKARDERKQ